MLIRPRKKIAGLIAARPDTKTAVKNALRSLCGSIARGTLLYRRALAAHLRRSRRRGAADPGLVDSLVRTAAVLRREGHRLEAAARESMAEAAELRSALPRLQEPRRVRRADIEVLVYEFGQPLTAAEAFAAALDVAPGDVTGGSEAFRSRLLPRAAADALAAETEDAALVLPTALLDRERPRYFVGGPSGVLISDDPAGAIVARDGSSSPYYLPGLARLPAGSAIALLAAT